ncbi:MAG TPA: UDP-N-acetylmuramoyl-tripeptide--D-alanyl-D-alanine ligase [Ignavibacteriaceae bacterium]|nr:UDP-N-acetylmuramoyl-tripeptide--D-alanyl-D-alanine ligase [Ignavibacteriaceae bacterium]
MKKINLTIEDIFQIPSAVIYNPDAFKNISHVSIDSRNIKKNTLFIAIKGERLDGHDFIDQAVSNGASSILINENYLKLIKDYDLSVITVKNTTTALGDIAKIWRKKLKAKVIGITGSAGKTTTKEVLAKLLSEKFKVNKTTGNHNNHIGVPLTILSTNEKHDVLVAELGTNHFGEIKYTASIASPDYGLITNIGDSHLEFLINRKGVLKEKSELLKETIRNDGKVFINNDDPLLKQFGKSIKNKITYALHEKADFKARIIQYDKNAKAEVEIKSNRQNFRVKLPLSGDANVTNYLAAFTVASELGVAKDKILKATSKLKSVDKRLEIKNYKKFTLINDTYNANPDSMKSSLDILNKIGIRKRKIAILGDMFELGKEAKVKHQELADYVISLSIDEVYTIGSMMNLFDKKLNKKINIHKHFSDRELLKKHLQKIDLNDSAVLIKGSRGMKMEEFVSVIQSRKN